jgi:hypothetical protein
MFKICDGSLALSQNWSMSCKTSSLLKKVIRVALFLLLGAAVTVGNLSYFQLLHFHFLYGAIGAGAVSVVGLALSLLEKAPPSCFTKEILSNKKDRPLNKDISLNQEPPLDDGLFMLGDGLNYKDCYHEACEEAIKKISSSKFKKIGLCMTCGMQSDIYFEVGDGHLRELNFEAYPNGSVLVIRMGNNEENARRITSECWYGFCVSGQDRLKDFVKRGHQHLAMSKEELDYLLKEKEFPQRIRDFIAP